MITSNSIHTSQEIFAIDVLTALKSSLKQHQKHVLRLLQLLEARLKLTNVKNSFSSSHNKQVTTVCGPLEGVLYQ